MRAPWANGSFSSMCLTKGRGPTKQHWDAGTLDGGAGKPGRLAGTGEGLLADKEHPWTLERARGAGQVMCVGVQSARQGGGVPEVNTSHNLVEPERVAVRPLVVWGEQ